MADQRADEKPVDPDDNEVKQADSGAVEATLDQLRSTLTDEEKQSDTLSQRASWLLAFCGVILGLGASQGDELLKRSRDLGTVGRPLASIGLALAVLAIAAAAALSLRALFLARKGRGIAVLSLKEIAKATDSDRLLKPKIWHQLREVRVLQAKIPMARALNTDVSQRLFGAFIALLVGVVLFLVHIGVFVEDSIETRSCPALRANIPAASGGTRFAVLEPQPRHTASTQIAQGLPPEVELPDCPELEVIPRRR